MKILKTQFRKNGLEYTLMKRTDKLVKRPNRLEAVLPVGLRK